MPKLRLCLPKTKTSNVNGLPLIPHGCLRRAVLKLWQEMN